MFKQFCDTKIQAVGVEEKEKNIFYQIFNGEIITELIA